MFMIMIFILYRNFSSRIGIHIVILTATLVVATVISAALVADVVRGRVSPGGGAAELQNRRPSQAMSKVCSKTRYPSLCVNSLLDYPGAVDASIGKDLVHKFVRALYFASEISNIDMDPTVRSAYEDCLELLDDSVDLLQRSLTSVAPSGQPAGSTQDVLTWLNSALTNQDTCSEGFDQLNGYVKSQLLGRLKDLSELVSNCLALYAAGASEDFSGIPIQNRRRRLVSGGNEHAHEHFPVWMTRRERRLLDLPVAAMNVDIVVSKDGNGTCKTIEEAIKKAPEHSSKRFIIYVRAGK